MIERLATQLTDTERNERDQAHIDQAAREIVGDHEARDALANAARAYLAAGDAYDVAIADTGAGVSWAETVRVAESDYHDARAALERVLEDVT